MNNSIHQAPTVIPVQKTEIKPLSSGKKIQALLLLFACILWVDFGLFGGFHAGYTVAMWATTIIYLIFAGKGKNTFYSYCCITLALLGTLIFSISQDTLILFTVYNLFYILMTAALCDRYEIGKYSTASFRNIADTIVLIVAYPFMALVRAIRALFAREVNKVSRNKGVLTGLICALPVIAIVVPLLISADAAFEKMLGFLKDFNFVRAAFAVILGVIIFFFLYAHAYGTRHRVYARTPRVNQQKRSLPTAALMSFSGAISLVYVLYIISQLTYFFSAFTGKTPTDFLPATYARRGFFEMCIICVINLIIMFCVILFSSRNKGKVQRPIAAICTFISLFSLLLITTAISKMVLYINRFGLTRLRLLTSAFMIFLGIVFILLILRLFITKLPYMRPVVLAAAIIIMLVGFADIDATIAHYNIHAYQSGKLSGIDIQQLTNLNDSAVPYMLTLLDDEDESVRNKVRMHLDVRRSALKLKLERKQNDFRVFNYSQHHAYRLLNENLDKLSSINT